MEDHCLLPRLLSSSFIQTLKRVQRSSDGLQQQMAAMDRRRRYGAAGEEASDDGVDRGVVEGEGVAGRREDDERELGATQEGKLLDLLGEAGSAPLLSMRLSSMYELVSSCLT